MKEMGKSEKKKRIERIAGKQTEIEIRQILLYDRRERT